MLMTESVGVVLSWNVFSYFKL